MKTQRQTPTRQEAREQAPARRDAIGVRPDHGLLRLQRTIGNANVGRMLGRAVVQRRVGTLGAGAVQVEDAKYNNNNWASIRTHMGAEWNGTRNVAPTGGHLLTQMVATWGGAHYSQAWPGNNATDLANGVYFTDANNLSKKIQGDQHEYFLVKDGDPSARKSSSFWPKGWSAATLKDTLDDSHTTQVANKYASKKTTDYWYTWQMIGGNTAFPLERYAKLD